MLDGLGVIRHVIKDGLLQRAEIVVPIVVKSELNLRAHWAARHRRTSDQRGTTALALRTTTKNWLPVIQAWPAIQITLTRYAPGKIRDSDNLIGGFKAVRDGVADFLQIDDSSPRILWSYGQVHSKAYMIGIAAERFYNGASSD